jgi:hypothetical protein
MDPHLTLAIHQPNFLPNLSFFYKMACCGIFIIVTNIQFEKGEGWQRRHKIKTHHGDQWLSVPVIGSQNQQIKDVRIKNDGQWQRKHTRVLSMTYGKTKEKDLLNKVLAIYEQPWERLVDLNMAFIELLREVLEIKKPKIILDEEVTGRKHELITNVLEKYQATTYLSGMGGKLYMNQNYFDAFEQRGYTCEFIDRDFNKEYPYTILHYLLTQGVGTIQKLLV